MKIAIDIPAFYPTAWKIAAGAFEYATRMDGIQIILPYAPMAREEDLAPINWDAAITSKPRIDLKVPQVCVSPAHIGAGIGASINQDTVVKLAVDQFVSMGLNSLGFFGSPNLPISKIRWSSFSKHVKSLGGHPVFVSAKEPEKELSQLRKPCGILAAYDDLGFMLIRACQEIKLRVPGDVHIISIDDTPECLESTPTLSSISMPLSLQGFHAARLCAQMIAGQSVESIQLPPSGLIIRDSLKVENDDIKTASEIAHYLRSNLSYPIQMADIVRRSSMSRRRLEQIFRSHYGASPIAYLKELRLDHAKEILRSSDVSLKDVANNCGYPSDNHLCRVFREQVGLSPQGFREANREGSS